MSVCPGLTEHLEEKAVRSVSAPSCTAAHRPCQREAHPCREILVILFLNCWAKRHFLRILRILLKIPAIWCVVVAADCGESRQSLLKVVWRLELREQLGTFVTGRLLTQNDGKGKKNPPWDEERREHPQSWEVGGSALAFESRLLCPPVTE